MKTIRLNKEFKLNTCNNIVLKYGTTNKFKPNVIYLTGRLWLCPTYDGDYEEILQHIHTNFKTKIKRKLNLCSEYNNKFILDFGIKADNLIPNKKKFFEIQLFIRQNDNTIQNIKNIGNSINNNIAVLFKELEDTLENNAFQITKSKNN